MKIIIEIESKEISEALVQWIEQGNMMNEFAQTDEYEEIEKREFIADHWPDSTETNEGTLLSFDVDEPTGDITKQQFDDNFRSEYLPMIAKEYEKDGVPDRPARREAYNDLVDSYHMDGTITEREANDWCIPDFMETCTP